MSDWELQPYLTYQGTILCNNVNRDAYSVINVEWFFINQFKYDVFNKGAVLNILVHTDAYTNR